MFNLLSKLEGVKESSFKIEEQSNTLFINNQHGVKIINNAPLKKQIETIQDPIVTVITDDNICVSSKATGQTKIFNLNGAIQSVDYLATVNLDIKNFLTESYLFAYTYFQLDFSKKYISKIERNSFKIISKFPGELGLNGILLVWDENHFISRNQEKFGLFTFENICVWEIYVKDLVTAKSELELGTPSIIKIVGKLFVEYGKTFRLNPANGNIEETYDVPFTASENEFLYGFQYKDIEVTQLAVLNAKTNEIKIIDIQKEFKKHDIYPDWRIQVKDGMIYFSQNMGSNEAKIGIFDPNQEKIAWKHIFEKKNGMVGTIKISKDRIFALTQDQTLHIFERE
ncbi:hypothetical protein OO013_10965 [Mangrovivirga sp. M17]|uniref:WD40 repeat domain-containing protein n=1 Tax=Mangrovivirga halotolerans TaxID=2993936 RepID=A0ABT3RRZ7_9BACT|nr:hypothetical protein [Mangrovivirga halotolerans]MCX2744391.1 hypothetical protein [Mangrovivirga halotolerans]